MNTPMNEPQNANAEAADAEYEAPCIESVLTPEDLEREVAYAGGVAGSTTTAA